MNQDTQKEQLLKDYDIMRRYGFDSDFARDKAILNFSFAIFMGLLAFFNVIRENMLAVLCAILAMLFSLVAVFMSFKVLKANSNIVTNVLDDQGRGNVSFQKLVCQMIEQNIKDGTWAYRCLWATIVCVVLCVLFYSGIKIDFASNTSIAQEISQEQTLNIAP